MLKTIDNDFGEGLNRTITLYSNKGGAIRAWNGKIDILQSGEEIFFDLNGKSVIIHGGIVVVEEN